MSLYDYDNDVMPYKKKSTAKTPKKSKHKHLFEPCIFEYPLDWWTKEHLRKPDVKPIIGSYCPICGKVGEMKDRDRWYTRETVFVGNMQFSESVFTEEGKREMDPKTRTLPCFSLGGPFDKFVTLPEREDEHDE